VPLIARHAQEAAQLDTSGLLSEQAELPSRQTILS